MIRIEVLKSGDSGLTTLVLTSNNYPEDRDDMDTIGNLIMTPYSKRGGYKSTEMNPIMIINCLVDDQKVGQ